MDIFDRLKQAAAREWESYVGHAFVRQLGEGTLPEAAFRTYLVQDYLFLIQFARAWALAAYKSRTIADIRAAQAGLAGILDETELHVRLCERWDISRDDIEAAPEHQATVAYTRFVLDCGAAGDLLDLQVALAPCVIGYAEIANKLAPNGLEALGEHPYREWIGEYAGEAYQAVAAGARRQLDDLAERSMTDRRFTELAVLFGKASRLEADFWQMGLDASSSSLAVGERDPDRASKGTGANRLLALSPVRPVAATIAAVFHESRILLVRRANPPDAGRWGFPGGKIEDGEAIETAAVRELLEETGVHAEALRVFTAVDAFDYDESDRLRQHFILIAVLCKWKSGEAVADDDALEARWFHLDELDDASLALSLDVAEVARQAAALFAKEVATS